MISSLKRINPLAIPMLAAVGLILGAYKLHFTIEEAFIHFRYATNLALGYGPVFNRGENIEGFNTPLWEYLLGGLHWLGGPLVLTAHAIGIIAGAVTVIATGLIANHLAQRERLLLGAIAALLVALHPGTIFWTASGMETMLFTALLLLSVVIGTLGKRPIISGLLFGLTTLTRSEGILFAVGVWLIIFTRGNRGFLKYFTPSVIAPLFIYEIVRLVYYGDILPNVFYTKAGFQFNHGLWYLWQFIRNGGFVFLLAPMALFGKQRQIASFWLVSIGAYLTWVVAIGGDFYAFHRFIIPIVPLLAILVILGIETLLKSYRVLPAILIGLGIVLWVGSMMDVYRYAESAANGMRVFIGYHRRIGETIRDHAPSGTTVAAIAMGAMPYYAGPEIRFIDMLGLNDSHIARQGNRVPDGLPGHSRYDNQYILQQQPDLIIIHIDPISSALKPLTAAAVRKDPENLKLFAMIAIETGVYHPPDTRLGIPKQYYALPVQLDFATPECQVKIARDYRPIAELPGNVPVFAYQRKGWSFIRKD